jgi:transposase-like protein
MNYLLRLTPCDIKIRGMAHRDALRHPLFGRRWFTDEVIITCVQWYLRSKLSYRDLAELARELGGQRRPEHSPVLDPTLRSRVREMLASLRAAGRRFLAHRL